MAEGSTPAASSVKRDDKMLIKEERLQGAEMLHDVGSLSARLPQTARVGDGDAGIGNGDCGINPQCDRSSRGVVLRSGPTNEGPQESGQPRSRASNDYCDDAPGPLHRPVRAVAQATHHQIQGVPVARQSDSTAGAGATFQEG